MGKAGALIVAHENVRKRLDPSEFADLVGRSEQAPPDALPVVTFSERMAFHWNDETIHIIHVDPAHTDGDAIVHFVNANVFHMGDLFFNGRYPFIDVNSGGDADGVIAAANRILEHVNSGSKLIPGHGDLATPDDLQAYRDMLVTVRSNVERLARQGMSEDEVVEAAPTAEFDAEWAAGRDPSRFVRAMYQAVVGN
jgi:glyoxylase-like metal-dependent hydrolase (beta-lactamase superfamily II)